jgi:hypothetical protein
LGRPLGVPCTMSRRRAPLAEVAKASDSKTTARRAADTTSSARDHPRVEVPTRETTSQAMNERGSCGPCDVGSAQPELFSHSVSMTLQACGCDPTKPSRTSKTGTRWPRACRSLSAKKVASSRLTHALAFMRSHPATPRRPGRLRSCEVILRHPDDPGARGHPTGLHPPRRPSRHHNVADSMLYRVQGPAMNGLGNFKSLSRWEVPRRNVSAQTPSRSDCQGLAPSFAMCMVPLRGG